MYAIRTEAVSCRPGWPQWSYINFVSSMFRLESESDLHNGDGLIIFLVLSIQFKVVVYPSYNDIHDIFLSEISSRRSRH